MTLVERNRRRLTALLAVPLLASTVWFTAPEEGVAQDATTATKAAKAPRPKSRTEPNASVVGLNANTLTVEAKEGNLNVVLTPTTEILRIEQNVPASALRVGDKVQFTLRGTNGMPTVSSVSPLTLRYEEGITLTFSNTEKLRIDRATQIPQTQIAAGQKVRTGINVFPDGRMEARTVYVLVPAPAVAR